VFDISRTAVRLVIALCVIGAVSCVLCAAWFLYVMATWI
jgi:hypothetical protein